MRCLSVPMRTLMEMFDEVMSISNGCLRSFKTPLSLAVPPRAGASQLSTLHGRDSGQGPSSPAKSRVSWPSAASGTRETSPASYWVDYLKVSSILRCSCVDLACIDALSLVFCVPPIRSRPCPRTLAAAIWGTYQWFR